LVVVSKGEDSGHALRRHHKLRIIGDVLPIGMVDARRDVRAGAPGFLIPSPLASGLVAAGIAAGNDVVTGTRGRIQPHVPGSRPLIAGDLRFGQYDHFPDGHGIAHVRDRIGIQEGKGCEFGIDIAGCEGIPPDASRRGELENLDGGEWVPLSKESNIV